MGTWRRWIPLLGKVAAIALVAAAVVAWFRFKAVPVTTHAVRMGSLVIEVMGTGTLEAHTQATISPKINGRIRMVLADDGDIVSEGDLLLRLEDEDLEQQAEIAEAGLAAARAAVARLKTDRERARAVAEQAARDYERTRTLFEEGTASDIERDKAMESLQVANAALAHAEAAIVEGEKQLIAAQKTLAYHQARLTDTQIRSPFAGLIVKRHRDPGDVVVPGSPVLTLIRTDELWVRAWVDETQMAALAPKQPARVIFRSEPEQAYAGDVVRLSREVDRQTREFVVDVRALSLPQNWAVGQRAEVHIATAEKNNVTLLAADFVVWRGERPGVFVDDGGTAAWRPMTIGARSRGLVEVIEGLAPGDVAIAPADPAHALRDGRRVKRL